MSFPWQGLCWHSWRWDQRPASFFVDYVEAENSSGFHADQESMRILGDSINYSRLGQLAVVKIELPKGENE